MVWSPWRSGICQSGTITWDVPGLAFTAGGSGPVQWERWSCQAADGPSPTRRHSGAALGSNSDGISAGAVRKRLV
jgi:hypothetical protein